jgi:hypothetical protein
MSPSFDRLAPPAGYGFNALALQAQRWVIAAASSIVIGNAAYDVAVSVHPQERVLLRQGIRVIREHVPKSDV